MKPFVTIFQGQGPDQHAKTSVCGLLSNLARKNVASIAYRFGHSRLPLQAFIGWDEWDDAPWRLALRHQVRTHWGPGDGVLVFDHSDFPSPAASRSVWPNSGVAVWAKSTTAKSPLLGYVSSKGHTVVDQRLLLPKDWTKDKARLDKAGVPNASRAYRTRHQLALEMLVKNSAGLPHGWIAGDDEMGRPYWFRRRLAPLGERYVLAVPANTAMRDLEVEPPSTAAGGDGLGVRGTRSRPGVMDVTMRPGSALRCAMGAKAHWWWRRLRGGWYRDPIGVNRATRKRWWSSVTVTATSKRWCKWIITSLTRRLRHRCGHLLGWPKPSIALKSVFREVKAKPVWRTMRGVIGRGGSIIKRFRYWPRGFWSEKPNGGKKCTRDDLPADSPGHRDDLARGVSVRHHAVYAQGAPEATATQ